MGMMEKQIKNRKGIIQLAKFKERVKKFILLVFVYIIAFIFQILFPILKNDYISFSEIVLIMIFGLLSIRKEYRGVKTLPGVKRYATASTFFTIVSELISSFLI